MRKRWLVLLMAAVALAGCSGAKPEETAKTTGPVTLQPPVIQSTPVHIAIKPIVLDRGGLDPRMAEAIDKAMAAAAAAGVELTVTSGYRKPSQQEEIFNEAVAQYGSPEEASKLALPAWLSHHVQGIAVDFGPNDKSRAWVEAHQDEFSLCRRYANETWHFELKRWDTCPPLLATAAEDK